MHQPLIDAVQASQEYRHLVRSRRRLSFSLSAIMVAGYYGFILCTALAPATLAHPLYAGATASVGIAAGMAVLLLAVALTGWYVVRASRTIDPLMAALVAKVRGA